MTINLELYQKFVKGVTSESSENLNLLIENMKNLDANDQNLNMSLLLTGVCGLSSESGEAMEIVKKVLFQGKPWNEDTRTHFIKELSDIIWYWTNACRSIGVDPNQVIEENVNKLQSRYPGGKFSIHNSENRKEGDL